LALSPYGGAVIATGTIFSIPAQDHFQPIQDHFQPVQDHFQPAQDHFQPAQDHFQLIKDHFHLVQDHFQPGKDQFHRIEDHFRLTKHGFQPALRIGFAVRARRLLCVVYAQTSVYQTRLSANPNYVLLTSYAASFHGFVPPPGAPAFNPELQNVLFAV
jgi:hypothetical protein